MTPRALLLVLALAGAVRAQSPAAQTQTAPAEAVIALDKFTDCGFVSRFSPNKINQECFQQLNNAVLDQDYSILRRNGYATYTTSPCAGLQSVRGEWPFYGTDGSQYLVVQSSNTMFASKGDGTCAPIAGLTNLSPTAQMSCVQGMGQLWCTDGVDPVFQTNVTSTATVTQAPTGKYIGFFRNRVMIAGVSGTLTNIYLSGELNGTDYTIPAVSFTTSPAILNISGTNDGQAVSCLMGEYQNGYYIGRQYDTYLLSGYSLADFAIQKVDQQIGCMDNNSPQMVNNTLMWLSRRGIESLTGTQINWVSYPIDPTIKVIINAAGNSQAFTVNTANFTSGNLTASGPGAPISSTIFPGNLTVSSATFSDQTNASFVTGTMVNLSTSGTANLALSVSTQVIADGNFQTGTNWSLLNTAQYSGTSGSVSAANGSALPSWCGTPPVLQCPSGRSPCAYLTFGGTGSAPWTTCHGYAQAPQIAFVDGATGNVLAQSSLHTPALTNPTGNTAVASAVATSTSMYVCLSEDPVGSGNQSINANCLTATNTAGLSMPVLKYKITLPVGYTATVQGLSYTDNSALQNVVSFSSVTISSYMPSGTYTSPTFDTSVSTPTMGVATVSYSSTPVATMTLQQEQSADGVSWSSPSTLVSGSIALAGQRYWRYLENFATSNGTTTANSQGLSTLAAATTGYYITPCVTATGNTSWGVLSVNGVTNGGSFTFWVSTGASCGSVTAANANWTLQTPNNIITVATSTFTAARVLFSVDAATEAPSINNISFNWNAGATRPPVASAQYLNKYYLFYTTSQVSGASNDHAVVFDQNAHWQLLDDVHAASSALYLNQLFLGDSQATGNIYLFDSGQSDAGGAFNFSFQTPDLDGGDPVSPKTFKRAYLILGAPSATTLSGTFACSYALSGSPTTYSLGTVNLSEAPEQGGYWVAKLPFPATSPTTGQWVNLSCTNTGTAGPLKVYGVRIVYVKNDWP